MAIGSIKIRIKCSNIENCVTSGYRKKNPPSGQSVNCLLAGVYMRNCQFEDQICEIILLEYSRKTELGLLVLTSPTLMTASVFMLLSLPMEKSHAQIIYFMQAYSESACLCTRMHSHTS